MKFYFRNNINSSCIPSCQWALNVEPTCIWNDDIFLPRSFWYQNFSEVAFKFSLLKIKRDCAIRMSHWRQQMVDSAEHLISCHWLAFLSGFSHIQLIQISAPSTICWCQCDIQILVTKTSYWPDFSAILLLWYPQSLHGRLRATCSI